MPSCLPPVDVPCFPNDSGILYPYRLCVIILQFFLFLTCIPYKLFEDASPSSDLFFSVSGVVHIIGFLFIEEVNKRLKLFFFPGECLIFNIVQRCSFPGP